MEECWKDIKGFEGYYQISTLGRVKSLSRMSPSKNGSYRKLKERILASKMGVGKSRGILLISLRAKELGENATFSINALIKKHFKEE